MYHMYRLCDLPKPLDRSIVQDEPFVKFTALKKDYVYSLFLWDLDAEHVHWWIANIRKEGGGDEILSYLHPVEEHNYVFYLVEQEKRVSCQKISRIGFPIEEHIKKIVEVKLW